VGAGPAGVAGALWARTLELEPLVIEAAGLGGGQLHEIHFHPRELPGVPSGDGAEIARAFERQLAEAAIPVMGGVRVAAIEPASNGTRVRLEDGARMAAPAVLVATGTRRGRLGVPGEAELDGRGVFGSARRELPRLAGRRVAVIGGGDGAYENALILAAAGCRVVLIVRSHPIARAEFQIRAGSDSGIEIVMPAEVISFSGEEGRLAIELETPAGPAHREVEAAVVKVGRVPETSACAALDRDPDGYLVVDRAFRTSVPGIWAAGDVARPTRPSIGAAFGAAGLALADIRRALRGD